MKNESVETQIFSLLNMTFPDRNCGPIARNTDLVRDLDADSMTMVSLIFSIDEKFHVGTDQLGNLIVDCRTVGDLIAATERLQQSRGQSAPVSGRTAVGRART
jgi:acyl carrier protein